jgi:hypothetical protein
MLSNVVISLIPFSKKRMSIGLCDEITISYLKKKTEEKQ